MDPMHCLQKCKRPSLLQGGGVYVYNGEVTFTDSNIYGNTAYAVSARLSPANPWPPWIACRKASAFLVLQGGGVYILDGTVNFQECNIYGNTAYDVSAHALHWSMAPLN